MANTLIRHFFFAVLIFIMFITGTVYLLNLVVEGESGNVETAIPGLMTSTGSEVDTFEDVFLNTTITKDIDDMKVKMDQMIPDPESGILTTTIAMANALIGSAWAAVRIVFDSLGLLDNILDGLSEYLHVPTWVPTLIITFIVAFFIFNVLSLVFGKEI